MLNDDIVRMPATTEQPKPFDVLATMDQLIDYSEASIKRLLIKHKRASIAGCALSLSRIERVLDFKKHKLEKQQAVRKAIAEMGEGMDGEIRKVLCDRSRQLIVQIELSINGEQAKVVRNEK